MCTCAWSVCVCIGVAKTMYIYTMYRYTIFFWQGNHQLYGRIRCIHTFWPAIHALVCVCVCMCAFVCVRACLCEPYAMSAILTVATKFCVVLSHQREAL